MAKYKETEMPDEAKQLFVSAQAGELTPKEFCLRLKEMGITGLTAMFYMAEAFKLPLEVAKTIIIEDEYGSAEAWAEHLNDVMES